MRAAGKLENSEAALVVYRCSIEQPIDDGLQFREDVRRDVNPFHRESVVNTCVQRLGLQVDPALVREIDRDLDAASTWLLVERLNEAAANAQIVDLNIDRQYPTPCAFKRSRHARRPSSIP